MITDPTFDPLPPHSTEAEEAVIGTAIHGGADPIARWTMLHVDDFYHPQHRDIWRSVVALTEQGIEPDIVSLTDALGDHWLPDLIRLSQPWHAPPRLPGYVEIIKRRAIQRRIISAAGKIAQIGYGTDSPIEDASAQAKAILAEACSGAIATDGPRHISAVMEDYLDACNRGTAVEGARTSVPTGFLDLDRLLGGLQPSDLVILASRPGLGKTSLALNIARNAAVTFNRTVLFFSLEMSRGQLAGRLLSAESGVDGARLRSGQIGADELRRIDTAYQELRTAPIWVDDTSTVTLQDVRQRAQRHAAEHGLDLLVLDYLQLMEGHRRAENRVQEVSAISRGLKSLAGELTVPVLALSQLNRNPEGRAGHQPMLSDLRESGSLEQDADAVLLLFKEEMYNDATERKGVVDLHVAKSRNGPTGHITLLFIERYTKFVDIQRG